MTMGVLFGIANAFVSSLQNTLFKKLPEVNPFVLNWFRLAVGVAVFAALVTVFSTWTLPPPVFWLLLFGLLVPVELGQSYFYVAAFQQAPQSLVGPLFSLSNLFLVPMGYFFLGEAPSFLGLIGILSVMAGPFLLGREPGETSWLGVWRRVFKERGARFMLLSALFAALAVTLSKVSLRFVTPFMAAFYVMAGLLIVISAILIFKGISPMKAFNRSVLGMSVAYSTAMVFHWTGLSLLLAAYYISLKRLSIVFDVFLGRLVHGEDNFRGRLFGAFLMVGGAVLIVLG